MADIIKLDANRPLDFDAKCRQAYDALAPVTISCSAVCSAKGPQGGDCGHQPRSAAACSRSASVPAFSLPQYAQNLRIFGTDISEAMLKKARKRVAELGLRNVEVSRSWSRKNSNSLTIRSALSWRNMSYRGCPNPEAALRRVRARAAAGRRT